MNNQMTQPVPAQVIQSNKFPVLVNVYDESSCYSSFVKDPTIRKLPLLNSHFSIDLLTKDMMPQLIEYCKVNNYPPPANFAEKFHIFPFYFERDAFFLVMLVHDSIYYPFIKTMITHKIDILKPNIVFEAGDITMKIQQLQLLIKGGVRRIHHDEYTHSIVHEIPYISEEERQRKLQFININRNRFFRVGRFAKSHIQTLIIRDGINMLPGLALALVVSTSVSVIAPPEVHERKAGQTAPIYLGLDIVNGGNCKKKIKKKCGECRIRNSELAIKCEKQKKRKNKRKGKQLFEKLKLCSCSTVYYCSIAHQKTHWKRKHRKYCNSKIIL